jgi:hypothetical protein
VGIHRKDSLPVCFEDIPKLRIHTAASPPVLSQGYERVDIHRIASSSLWPRMRSRGRDPQSGLSTAPSTGYTKSEDAVRLSVLPLWACGYSRDEDAQLCLSFDLALRIFEQ